MYANEQEKGKAIEFLLLKNEISSNEKTQETNDNNTQKKENGRLLIDLRVKKPH